MPKIISVIEIYLVRNIYAIIEINLKVSKEPHQQLKIVAELKKRDGEIIEGNISPYPASLTRKIAKKIKKMSTQ